MERARSPETRCRICGGHDRNHRGQGIRCFGYVSTDGQYAHCTRAEFAGPMPPHIGAKGGETYAHRLRGPCDCGVQHGEHITPIGESQKARTIAIYDYRDAQGTLRYQVLRKEPKAFVQRRPDGQGGWLWNLQGVEPLLYKLPELLETIAAGEDVWIVEGERDVETLARHGAVATCNSGGCGKFPPAQAVHFRGATVTIVADKDEPGRKHAQQIRQLLEKAGARSVEIVEAKHGKDATDHLVAGGTLADFQIPQSDPADVLGSGPWKARILRTSLEAAGLARSTLAEGRKLPPLPTWPTGLRAGALNLRHFQGVTILTGAPGAAKSYLALASSIEAARAGWEVEYLAAEMSVQQITERVDRYTNGEDPEHWSMTFVDFGADLPPLIEHLCARVSERNLLVVFDSISSFVDASVITQTRARSEDPNGVGLLKRLLMWALNVKRKTHGKVSFLVLSEANAQGLTKWRFGDHKADLVLSMRTDPEQSRIKELELVKAWDGQTGKVGRYRLDWIDSSLNFLGE